MRRVGIEGGGVRLDGDYLGWKSLAASCEGAQMSIGAVIKFLNKQKGEPYIGPIWSSDEDSGSWVADIEDAEVSVGVRNTLPCWIAPKVPRMRLLFLMHLRRVQVVPPFPLCRCPGRQLGK